METPQNSTRKLNSLKKKNIDLLAELHKQLKEEISIAEETI